MLTARKDEQFFHINQNRAIMNQLTKTELKPIEQRMIEMGYTPQRIAKECSFALQQINHNDYLKKCSKRSLQEAILNIANIGLSLNPAAREAYLIPRWNNKLGVSEARLEPSYIGLSKLIVQSGAVTNIIANVVFENDHFSVDLADSHKPVTHRPELSRAKRGNCIGAYALATLPNDSKQVEWIDIYEINKIREMSESWKKQGIKSVWGVHPDEMARKTVIKRIYKYLPRAKGTTGKYIDEAIEIDNQDYKATFEQRNYIDSLQRTSILTSEELDAIDEEMRGDVSFHRASEIIESLLDNQVEQTVANGYGASMKQLGRDVENAVNDETK